MLTQAQQLRYVDTDYILNKFPQYEQAKSRLQSQVNAWKSEIQKESDEIDKMQLSLENEKVILTEDKIVERQEEIDDRKAALNSKIEQKFGVNGESQQMRINLVKPLQDQIWSAINSIAQKQKYHMIFDKASGANLIYADDKYDITEMVIKELALDQLPEPKRNNPSPRKRNGSESKLEKNQSIGTQERISTKEKIDKK